MAEEKSHLGLWALLVLLVGGGIFAATKVFGAKKVTYKIPTGNGHSPTPNPSPTPTPNPSPTPTPVITENDATKVGYPYSVKIKGFSHNGKNTLSNSWLYNDGNWVNILSEKRADGWYINGRQSTKGNYTQWYVYSLKDGSFMGVYSNSRTGNGTLTYVNPIQAFTGYK